MATKLEIAEIISTAKAAYPNFQPDSKTPEVWFVLLNDLPGETLKAATLACLTEPGRIFAPGVGEIRGMVLKLHAQSAGIPTAYAAYQEVVDAPVSGLVYLGEAQPVPGDPEGRWFVPHRKYEWSHPLVEAVACKLGWPAKFPTDQPGVDRAQFVKAYDLELASLMGSVNQLPALRDYVERKSLEMEPGTFLPAISNLTRRLEHSHATDQRSQLPG